MELPEKDGAFIVLKTFRGEKNMEGHAVLILATAVHMTCCLRGVNVVRFTHKYLDVSMIVPSDSSIRDSSKKKNSTLLTNLVEPIDSGDTHTHVV